MSAKPDAIEGKPVAVGVPVQVGMAEHEPAQPQGQEPAVDSKETGQEDHAVDQTLANTYFNTYFKNTSREVHYFMYFILSLYFRRIKI